MCLSAASVPGYGRRMDDRAIILAAIVTLATSTAASALDGDLDPTFGAGGFAPASLVTPTALAIRSDGAIAVAASGPATNEQSIVLLDTSGGIDATFGAAGVATLPIPPGDLQQRTVERILVRPDDGVVVVRGRRSAVVLQAGLAIVQLLPDGTPDLAFGAGGLVTSDEAAVADAILQPDGRIVTVGTRTPPPASLGEIVVQRFEADGDPDSTFGSGGAVIGVPGSAEDWLATSIALQPDGRLVVAGSVESEGFLARYESDGTLDGTFGTAGVLRTTFPSTGPTSFLRFHDVAIQADGGLVAAGQARLGTGDVRWALARYDASGVADGTFGTNGEVTTRVGEAAAANDVVVQSDGRIAVGGYGLQGETDSNEANVAGLLRYHTDGSLDAGFANACPLALVGRRGGPEGVRDLAMQSDGKLVVAADDGLARLGSASLAATCDPGLPGGSKLVVKQRGNERIVWRARSAMPLAPADVGDPVAGDTVAWCLLAAGELVEADAALEAACASSPCWKQTGSGYKYKNNLALGGKTVVKAITGDPGRARFQLRQTNTDRARLAPPLDTPIVLRVKTGDGTGCWEATFSTPVVNETGRLKALSD